MHDLDADSIIGNDPDMFPLATLMDSEEWVREIVAGEVGHRLGAMSVCPEEKRRAGRRAISITRTKFE